MSSTSSLALQDEGLLVLQILRGHLEVAADQHGNLGQVQRPVDGQVRAVVLHGPVGEGSVDDVRGDVQLRQEGLVAHLFQHTVLTETGHAAAACLVLDFFDGDGELGDGGGTATGLEHDAKVLDFLNLMIHFK